MIDHDSTIKLMFPHGAGGWWLASVIGLIIHGKKWNHCDVVHFHQMGVSIPNDHYYEYDSHTLSLTGSRSKWNFWYYYIWKRIIHDIPYFRYQGQRLTLCPYEQLEGIDNFRWLLNQARYVESYDQHQREWELEWTDLFVDRKKFWKKICEFLENHRLSNKWAFDEFDQSFINFNETLPKTVHINPNHKLFHVWALAYLQNRDITPPFLLDNNFKNVQYTSWIEQYIPEILDYTRKQLFKCHG